MHNITIVSINFFSILRKVTEGVACDLLQDSKAPSQPLTKYRDFGIQTQMSRFSQRPLGKVRIFHA